MIFNLHSMVIHFLSITVAEDAPIYVACLSIFQYCPYTVDNVHVIFFIWINIINIR